MSGFAHRSLRVYGMSVEVMKRVYQATRSVPPSAWPIAKQAVRAASSIALNIAEGAGEYAPREKARFYRMARRSAAETSAALDLLTSTSAVAPTSAQPAQDLLEEIGAILTQMTKTQEARTGRAVPSP